MTTKIAFFEGCSSFKFDNLGLALGINLKLCNNIEKRVKTKSQEVLEATSYVCRSYRGKTGRGGLFAPLPPILKMVNNLNLLNYKTLWQGDHFCQSIKDRSSKQMAVEKKILTSITLLYLHLLTNIFFNIASSFMKLIL